MKEIKFSAETKNKITAVIFLMAGILSLEILPSSVEANALGVSFIIASLYGFLCISKKAKFLF